MTASPPSWCAAAASRRWAGPTLLLDVCPHAIARAPGSFGRMGHCHLDLAAADDATIHSVTLMSWRRHAPKPLARDFAPHQ
jgi:hypothetical protein